MAGPLVDRSCGSRYVTSLSYLHSRVWPAQGHGRVACYWRNPFGVGWNGALCHGPLLGPFFHRYSRWNFRDMPGMDDGIFRQERGWDR